MVLACCRDNLEFVRTVRICLLLLLVLLIPARGVVAATMLCLPAGSASQNEQRAEDHAHHGHMGHDAADSQADAGHHDGGHHPDGGSKCTLCSACCSSAPLLHSVPGVVAAQDLSSATFPDLSAPP